MTTASLAAGGALLAFGPAGALLLVLVSHKANLVIVVTTSAFAYLCSAVVSALLWLPVPEALRGNPYVIIFPSVAVQFFFRAGYVWLYHRIEDTVEKSIERHSVARARGQTRRQQQHGGPSDQSDDSENDPARLRLELNDWSSGLAAGCGFGGMHAALLYGTLLASEVGNLGTLYQPSCDIMPSLVNAAVVAALFSICDCLWMLLTFFGMRRRRDKRDRLGAGFGAGADALAAPYHISNDRWGGGMALVLVALSHAGASLCTVPNSVANGCVVALPCLGGVTALTGAFFWIAISGHYLPPAQTTRVGGRITANGSARYED